MDKCNIRATEKTDRLFNFWLTLNDKLMKLLTMLLCLGLIGCTNGQIKREGEPTIINIQDGDKEMNDAIKKANDTLDEFKNALNGKKAHLQYFALKTRFNTPIGGEHI
jgi:hypothetical protein